MQEKYSINVLIADDDPDDRVLLKEAFEENFLTTGLRFVENGEDLMDYLLFKGKHSSREKAYPSLILLDLNMPRKDGREALKEIKTHPVLKNIPVLIFTTSKSQDDMQKTSELGANSFITKPVTFVELVEVTRTIGKYWFETALICPVHKNTVENEH